MDTATRPAASADVPVRVAVPALRDELRSGREALKAAFLARPDTPRLLARHARLVDHVVREAWRETDMPPTVALIAVGGYGRGRLFPHSDVDLLMLLPPGDAPQQAIERFLATLWDIGLEVSHAVRTQDECISEMAGDVTIRTSLLEHRFIAGRRSLYREFARAFDAALEIRAFHEAKTLEQQQRHLKYHDAAYNLEPNVKESPGGLRDLQTVMWIARAAGLGKSWRDLARAGLMTMAEARAVSRQERFIGAMRVRLHYLAGRREDRLVFDLQSALAKQVGYLDSPTRRASEQLMQRYYRAAKTVRQINTILLQNLHARLFPIPRHPVPISDDFCAIDELLHVSSEELFDRKPSAMLDAFLLMQRHPELKGMSARTLRALWRWRHRVDATLPPRPGQPRALHRDLPRAARHPARAAADEPVRHPRRLPAGVRPHRRADAARPVPRLHGRRAHPDGDPQPAPLHRDAARARVPALLAADGRRRAQGRALPRRAVPRHREGPRRRPLGPRRARREALRPRPRPRQARRRRRGLAGRAAPGDVVDRAEAGHLRPGRRRRLRRARAHRGAARPALPADRRGHPRHEPEGVERVEGASCSRTSSTRPAA